MGVLTSSKSILIFLFAAGVHLGQSLSVFSGSTRGATRQPIRRTTLEYTVNDDCDEDGKSVEVVGAAGRFGSFWFKHAYSTTSSAQTIAVPRGVSPGCMSSAEAPIYVATPSTWWGDIRQNTLPERRDDLVWVGNGILLPEFESSTVVVPHYGVLKVGDKPVTSPVSPPTLVYGKHSDEVKSCLEDYDVQTEILGSWEEVKVAAVRKLLWASSLWLLCHYNTSGSTGSHLDSAPLTVSQVHAKHQPLLKELVKELLPALQDLAVSSSAAFGQNGYDDVQHFELQDTLEYLTTYSMSIPHAIVSKELAVKEVQERNGVLLKLESNKHPQPLHRKLLENVMGRSNILDDLSFHDDLKSSSKELALAKGIDRDLSRAGANVKRRIFA